MINVQHVTPQMADDGFGSASLGGGPAPIAFNPYNRQVGDSLTFSAPDLAGLSAHVDQILTTKVSVDGQVYLYTDYEVSGKKTDLTAPLADEDGLVRLKVRCILTDEGALDTTVFQSQRLDEGAGWQFDNLRKQQGAVALRNYKGGFEHGFTRIDETTEVYLGERTVIGDPRQGDQGAASMVHHQIYSLDYEREVEGNGEPYTQYGIVEFNKTTNMMATFFGWSIDPKDIH